MVQVNGLVAAEPMSVSMDLDEPVFDVVLGIDLLTTDAFVLQLYHGRSWSEFSDEDRTMLKLKVQL